MNWQLFIYSDIHSVLVKYFILTREHASFLTVSLSLYLYVRLCLRVFVSQNIQTHLILDLTSYQHTQHCTHTEAIYTGKANKFNSHTPARTHIILIHIGRKIVQTFQTKKKIIYARVFFGSMILSFPSFHTSLQFRLAFTLNEIYTRYKKKIVCVKHATFSVHIHTHSYHISRSLSVLMSIHFNDCEGDEARTLVVVLF